MTKDELIRELHSVGFVQSFLPDSVRVNDFLKPGGQGVVYRGSVSGEIAAVKIYFPGQLEQRIEREIEALRRINCPSIVRLLWNQTISFNGYDLKVVATEFVPGLSLHDHLQNAPLIFDEAAILAFDVARAIEEMWGYRIVHRDIKPNNILIRPSGRFCVIDLGVARHIDRTDLTAINLSYGTIGYLSPEQAHTVRMLTCKSDVYSLGVTLLESLLGKHPTNGDQDRLLATPFHQHLPVNLQDWEFEGLLKSMLNPKPFTRPLPSQIMQKLQRFG